MLLHDLGKGHDRDHSELGRDIAETTAERFELDTHQRELLTSLVYRHLLMSHLAFRRDTSDGKLLRQFARQVGTPEVLQMLFVLTAADIASVGPEMWTSWKADVLTDLYARTMELLTGDVYRLDRPKRVENVQRMVRDSLVGEVAPEWLERHLDAMPQHYALNTPPERITEHLR